MIVGRGLQFEVACRRVRCCVLGPWGLRNSAAGLGICLPESAAECRVMRVQEVLVAVAEMRVVFDISAFVMQAAFQNKNQQRNYLWPSYELQVQENDLSTLALCRNHAGLPLIPFVVPARIDNPNVTSA